MNETPSAIAQHIVYSLFPWLKEEGETVAVLNREYGTPLINSIAEAIRKEREARYERLDNPESASANSIDRRGVAGAIRQSGSSYGL